MIFIGFSGDFQVICRFAIGMFHGILIGFFLGCVMGFDSWKNNRLIAMPEGKVPSGTLYNIATENHNSTISMAIFQFAMLVITRGYTIVLPAILMD